MLDGGVRIESERAEDRDESRSSVVFFRVGDTGLEPATPAV